MWDFDYHTFTLYNDYQYSGSFSTRENDRIRQWEILKLDSKTSTGKYYFSDLAKRDPQFRQRLIDRWNMYKNTWKTGLPAYLDEMANYIRISEYYNQKKWGYSNKQNGDCSLSFQESVNAMKTAFQRRWQWMDENLPKLGQ